MSGSFESKNFIATLFDFSFTSFITLRFMKVIYGVLLVLILLTGLVFLLAGLFSGDATTAILALVGVPIVTLFYLVIARIYMELIALFFRIGENTSLIASSVGGAPGGSWGGSTSGASGPQGPGSWGGPPPPASSGPPTMPQ